MIDVTTDLETGAIRPALQMFIEPSSTGDALGLSSLVHEGFA